MLCVVHLWLSIIVAGVLATGGGHFYREKQLVTVVKST